MASSLPASASTATPAVVVSPVSTGRIFSLDILRGLIMVFMALDHVRDFFTNLSFEPETLSRTYYALFFTRWITHFCAPLFFFLAGTGAFLYGRRHTARQLSRFLWTRGVWLILLEFTVVGTAWTFLFPWGFFGVIWALGASMVVMSVVVYLPNRWIAALSVGMILTHNLLDSLRPPQFGWLAWLWTLLHARGEVTLPHGWHQFVLFPLIPLAGVMAAGYAFGELYLLPPDRRRRLLLWLGFALTLAFVALRATNLYGNPPAGLGGVSQGDWHIQPTVEKTLILFLDVEKYPPSLQFLLMTLGPSLLLLAWLEKKTQSGANGVLAALLTFGRVPMFFYVLHLYLIHILAVLIALLWRQPVGWLFRGAVFADTPAGYGHGLSFVYLMWMITIAALYLPCRWFAAVKRRRKDWRLSYI